jgi:hypothetical protein
MHRLAQGKTQGRQQGRKEKQEYAVFPAILFEFPRQRVNPPPGSDKPAVRV